MSETQTPTQETSEPTASPSPAPPAPPTPPPAPPPPPPAPPTPPPAPPPPPKPVKRRKKPPRKPARKPQPTLAPPGVAARMDSAEADRLRQHGEREARLRAEEQAARKVVEAQAKQLTQAALTSVQMALMSFTRRGYSEAQVAMLYRMWWPVVIEQGWVLSPIVPVALITAGVTLDALGPAPEPTDGEDRPQPPRHEPAGLSYCAQLAEAA